ncbi:hypothetical protein Hanom_Chr03g00207451 [Helianthus anomalus]
MAGSLTESFKTECVYIFDMLLYTRTDHFLPLSLKKNARRNKNAGITTPENGDLPAYLSNMQENLNSRSRFNFASVQDLISPETSKNLTVTGI